MRWPSCPITNLKVKWIAVLVYNKISVITHSQDLLMSSTLFLINNWLSWNNKVVDIINLFFFFQNWLVTVSFPRDTSNLNTSLLPIFNVWLKSVWSVWTFCDIKRAHINNVNDIMSGERLNTKLVNQAYEKCDS